MESIAWFLMTLASGECPEIGNLDRIRGYLMKQGLRSCMAYHGKADAGYLEVVCFPDVGEVTFKFYSSRDECVKELNKYRVAETKK